MRRCTVGPSVTEKLDDAPARARAIAIRDETDLDRLIGLSDGVFAFALTLLVLSLTVPQLTGLGGLSSSQVSGRLAANLQHDYTTFIAYVFAFVMIATWWTNHNRTFRYIYRYDVTLVWLNFAVLLEVSVMPFVLGVFATYSDTVVGIGLFAAVQAATGFTLNMMWRYAIKENRLIHPDFDRATARRTAEYGILPCILFAASIPAALISPLAAYAVWAAVFPVRRLGRKQGV
jgi:uncharacterized membrane protein